MAADTMSSTDTDAGKQALLAFWAEYRLLEVEGAIREFLGVETITDLDDVKPGDLQTLRACQWADARLTVAQANRLARAVKSYHAVKHGYPEPGAEHLPRCRACSCQGDNVQGVDGSDVDGGAFVLRRSMTGANEDFLVAGASGI
jgi:hypothetical protein